MSPERMKLEQASKLLTAMIPPGRDDLHEAWSVIADRITERGQYPQIANRRDGALDLTDYLAKVRIR